MYIQCLDCGANITGTAICVACEPERVTLALSRSIDDEIGARLERDSLAARLVEVEQSRDAALARATAAESLAAERFQWAHQARQSEREAIAAWLEREAADAHDRAQCGEVSRHGEWPWEVLEGAATAIRTTPTGA